MKIDTGHLAELKTLTCNHLENELLPFWLDRCLDTVNGGYITHFDQKGNDTGQDKKSLISQTRCLYTMSSALRSGYFPERCAELAAKGIEFLIDKYWDKVHGGFYWMADKTGQIIDHKKILYGQSFAIYALAEYALATGDETGGLYARKTFDIINEKCTDRRYGGFYEMFEWDWTLRGPGAAGGDRKTLDTHMHLMEAFTTLYELTEDKSHRSALTDCIHLFMTKILHPHYRTGMSQFTIDWRLAPQIKFKTVWGWDRFEKSGRKKQEKNTTSYGHNCELAWLLIHALRVLDSGTRNYEPTLKKLLEHTLKYGIDQEQGGVYVEGPFDGEAYDLEKEFWQQAEVLVAMLDGCLLLNDEKYWEGFLNVHRFVFDKVIDHKIGEWLPLLTREGEPIWTHLGHSWKINYHTVRSMIQCVQRLNKLERMI